MQRPVPELRPATWLTTAPADVDWRDAGGGLVGVVAEPGYGAILVVSSTNVIVSSLAFLAIVLSSINIFGGFTITDRMLGMFRKEEA